MSTSREALRTSALSAARHTREMYGVALTLEAIDHYLLHDHGRLGERVAVPLRGLRRELRDCLAVCVVELQGEINRRRGTDNPVVIARMGELA